MSIDPMYAYFNIEEPTAAADPKNGPRGPPGKRRLGDVAVQMGLADDVEQNFPLAGMLDFANNTVDPQTGTFRSAACSPTRCLPGRPPLLMPGLFVRVRLSMGTPHKGC